MTRGRSEFRGQLQVGSLVEEEQRLTPRFFGKRTFKVTDSVSDLFSVSILYVDDNCIFRIKIGVFRRIEGKEKGH